VKYLLLGYELATPKINVIFYTAVLWAVTGRQTNGQNCCMLKHQQQTLTTSTHFDKGQVTKWCKI